MDHFSLLHKQNVNVQHSWTQGLKRRLLSCFPCARKTANRKVWQTLVTGLRELQDYIFISLLIKRHFRNLFYFKYNRIKMCEYFSDLNNLCKWRSQNKLWYSTIYKKARIAVAIRHVLFSNYYTALYFIHRCFMSLWIYTSVQMSKITVAITKIRRSVSLHYFTYLFLSKKLGMSPSFLYN